MEEVLRRATQKVTLKRYNAGIQRAKGLLEVAASLYDSSLSFQTTRAAEGVLQTDSRLGRTLRLSLLSRANPSKNDVSVSFATGGFQEILAVAEGKVSLAWINPSAILTLAYRGKDPFRKRLPLRTIAVFPSYDVIGLAVHKSTGITSLSQVRKERIAVRLSTAQVTQDPLKGNATIFTVTAIMRAAGLTWADIRKWGGKIHSVGRPSDPARRASIESGTVNAIFDEGIKSWGQTAVDHGFYFLPMERSVVKSLARMGYRPAVMPKSLFQGMPEDVPTVDFSGWPMLVRADMPEDLAYALCEAIESRKEVIPTDNFKPLDIAQLCANDEEAPYDVPLHPGAQRFYRERGHLK